MRILSGLLERDLELKETTVSRPQMPGERMLPPALPTFVHAIACRGLGGSSFNQEERFHRR